MAQRPESSRQRARTWGYPRREGFLREVRAAARDWFQARGFRTSSKYPYILADRADWPKNIILAEVASFVDATVQERARKGARFPLHKYVHHGLSSQALLFNLLGPLLVRGLLAPLRSLIEKRGLKWPSSDAGVILEYEDKQVFNEDTGQPTSVDLAVTDQHGVPRVVIEAKFVEEGFGGCSVYAAGDCDGRNPAGRYELCYLHHIGRTYWQVMERHGLIQGTILSDATCVMANHYQFFREVLLALEKGGAFVLLSDERSPVFRCGGPGGDRGLMPTLLEMLPEDARKDIAEISIQALVLEIAATGGHEWWQEFALKYGLGAAL